MTCSSCQSLNPDQSHFCTRCGAALIDAAASVAQAPAVIQTPAGEDRQGRSLVGRSLDGKYRLEARLGSGGMGIVYRATRLHINDEVALKVLRAELLADPQAFERFRREAQAAACLKHPNVVTIHDFGVTDAGTAYLVMELVEGQSLRDLIEQHGRLTQADAVEIAAQVCAALDEAHRQQIIHRDLKPDNIIVTATSSGLRVKVLDFGIAKLANPPTGGSRLTLSGAVLGTPIYMSPEQCLGEALDGRSDIYSLGIVLYEMLSGTVPFTAPSMGALIIQQVQQPPTPLSAIHIGTLPALDVAVQQALEKRREARPQSAAAFAEMLRAALSSNSTTPTVTGPPFIPVTPPVDGAAALAPTVNSAATAPAFVGARAAGQTGRKPIARLVLTVVVLALVAAVTMWRILQGGAKPAGDFGSLSAPPVLASREGAASGGALDQALAQAEADYRNRRYDAVIAACNEVLSTAPEQSRANLLIGESYYQTGNARAAVYLGKAIELGETVTLAVKHHHYEGVLKINDGFCAGSFHLRRGAFEFRSDDVSEHSFAVTPDKLFDLQDESYRGGRLHLRASVNRGGTEVVDNYNFYAPTAGLRKQMTLIKVYCENPGCQPMAQTLYQLLVQLKR